MPLRLTLRQLEYFIAAGECGSIAAAGDKLNVSSPSISASITQLEAELGQTLFIRKRSHGLTLTDAGARLLRKAQDVVDSANDLVRLADTMSDTVQGVLRLGCLSTFAQVFVPILRSRFQSRYEAAEVLQFELNQSEIFSALRRSDIDLALTYDLDIPEDVDFVPTIDLPPFVLCARDHPLSHLDKISIGDLKPFPMVLLDLPHSADYFLSIFNQGGFKPIVSERTKDMAVMRSLVANGFGYSIANLRPLNNLAPDGQPLEFRSLQTEVPPIRLGFAMAKGAAHNPTIHAFSEHFAELIAKKALPGLG